jgi:hypothetical protein
MAQREGYLFVDHRASPGFTDEAMARRMGGVVGSKLIEMKTLTCCHCKTPVLMNPLRQRERGKCPKCSMKYLCDFCWAETFLPDYDHTPHEKKVELALKGG